METKPATVVTTIAVLMAERRNATERLLLPPDGNALHKRYY